MRTEAKWNETSLNRKAREKGAQPRPPAPSRDSCRAHRTVGESLPVHVTLLPQAQKLLPRGRKRTLPQIRERPPAGSRTLGREGESPRSCRLAGREPGAKVASRWPRLLLVPASCAMPPEASGPRSSWTQPSGVPWRQEAARAASPEGQEARPSLQPPVCPGPALLCENSVGSLSISCYPRAGSDSARRARTARMVRERHRQQCR